MYGHRQSREPFDSSPLSSNNSGRVSTSLYVEGSAILSAAAESRYHCDKSQADNIMAPEERSSKSEPRSPKPTSSTGQHIGASASSRPLQMTSREHPVYASIAGDTKELESSFVEAAIACVPQPRPGTKISTLLSPVPPTPSNDNKGDGSVIFTRKDSAQATTLADVEIPDNIDSGVSSASRGKLVSAREQLRLLLRGPGRKRHRKSRSLFPPSP